MDMRALRRPVHEVLDGEFVTINDYFVAYECAQEEEVTVAKERYISNLFKKDDYYYAPNRREILVIAGTELQHNI